MMLIPVLVCLFPVLASSRLVLDNRDFTIWTYPDKNVADVTTSTIAGVGLIGGGTDSEEAFNWQISNTNKGDFVILRASGDDAYNSWVYDLSVAANKTLNSVTTILFKNKKAASNSEVTTLLNNAEAFFFAGGDQGAYMDLWVGTPVQTIVQDKIKSVTIAGTSAGLAIMGNWVYTAENGSAESEESLLNPYIKYVESMAPALFHVPYMTKVITDTHFSMRDRMGRLLTFMARIVTDSSSVSPTDVHAMGVDEETALLLNYDTGVVTAVGHYHAFICQAASAPTVCAAKKPLTYNGITCTRLSGPDHDTFSLDSFTGGGVSYKVDIEKGAYTKSSQPYGPTTSSIAK